LDLGDSNVWLERLKAQDEQAQRELWERYYPAIHHRARTLARNHALHDANDIAQETFLRAFRSIQTFEGRTISKLKVWLMVLCQRAAADHYPPRHTRDVPAGYREVVAAHPEKTPAPLKVVMNTELSDHLREGLAMLTPEQQAVVAHRFFEDLSVRETAELMGKTEPAVKMLLYRALEKLGSLFRLGGDAP